VRVTLIRPSITGGRPHDAMEPLAFAILAGLTPADAEVDVFDERTEDAPPDRRTDLVALTVETYTARRAYQIAREYRRRGVPVVMGGFHPSLPPGESLAFADAVVLARMTPDELTEGRMRARAAVDSASSIARRALDPRANCRGLWRPGLFLAANVMSKRELSKKLGRPLGLPGAPAPLPEVS